ncbi:TRAUB-domain-containing protein [Serendipita vermifera]|nr:TRAUB-domain-containing protein [Serendipita vermifera]
MAASRLTLAQQISQLEDPTPIDIDPEDEPFLSRDGGDDESDSNSSPALNGTGHYLDVGPSKLRKLHDSLNEPKYAGKKIYHELGAHTWDDAQEYSSASQDELDSTSSSEDEREGSEERMEMEMHEPQGETTDDLSSALKKAKESDRRKGNAVSHQMAIWEALLDSRIRLHKASQLCNTLPTGSHLASLASHERGKAAIVDFVEESLRLSEDIFELQEALLEVTDPKLDRPTYSRKGHMEPNSTYGGEINSTLSQEISAASHALAQLQSRYHPELLSTLRKWSAKIQAVTPSNLLPSSRNAFKNSRNMHLKPITDVIQEALGDHTKALSRTRIRRGGPRMGREEKTHLDVEGRPLEEEENELFDDTDFYQQLLRDVIDGKANADYGEGDIFSKPKKIKKQVDTRASKGRKLRYEVHEKIQNFMVPVPTIVDGWHEEKIDELFSSLLGKSADSIDATHDSGKRGFTEIRHPSGTVVQDGFRIFG